MYTFFVVFHNSVNLLGRDLFEKLNIKIVLPDAVNAVHDIRSEFMIIYLMIFLQMLKRLFI